MRATQMSDISDNTELEGTPVRLEIVLRVSVECMSEYGFERSAVFLTTRSAVFQTSR